MNAPEFGPDGDRERRKQPANILRRQRVEDPGQLIMQHDVNSPVSVRWHVAMGGGRTGAPSLVPMLLPEPARDDPKSVALPRRVRELPSPRLSEIASGLVNASRHPTIVELHNLQTT
jgi:hypothetical protein